MRKVRKAIIPAAGFGTRFLPATKSLPKEMLTIVDKPAIQYIVEEVIQAGIEDILIINGRNKEPIVNHFDRSPELENLLREKNQLELLQLSESVSEMANIHFLRQKDMLGLGHAVRCARTFVGDEPFAVLLGDDIVVSDVPCIRQLTECFEACQCPVIGVQPVDWSQVNKYGIVDGEQERERVYRVRDLVEKPDREEAPSNIAILGRYVLTPEIFDFLDRTAPGKGGEIQLTDGMKQLLAHQGMVAYEFEGKRYDTGDKLGYLKANVEFALVHGELGADFRAYLKQLEL